MTLENRNGLEPPKKWFIALGYKERGILTIRLSDEFAALANGKVGRTYDNWLHLVYRPKNPDNPTRNEPKDEKLIADAEAFIL